MNLPRNVPLRVVLGLAAAVFIDTAVQITWKTAVLKIPDDTSLLAAFAVFQEPFFIVVLCVMTLQFFNWMAVLSQADLSFAQPFTALSYVTVALISALFLGETVDRQQMLGIGFVIAGVWFISRTSHMTQRDAEGVPVPVHEAKPQQGNSTRNLIGHEGVCTDC